MAVIKLNTKIDVKKAIIIFTLMVSILPYENILEKYLNSEEYILSSGKERESYTQLKKYKNHINQGDKILFITASNSNLKYIKSINEYEINAKINSIIPGFFKDEKEFENIAKGYDYVFIYEMTLDIKERIKSKFEYENVKNDTFYKVSYNEHSVMLNELK